jgi:hypothetical protein
MSAPWCACKGAAAQYCCINCLKCGIHCECRADSTGKLPALVSALSKQVADRERELRRAQLTNG